MRAERVFELLRLGNGEWIVIDRSCRLLDRGPDLAPLRERWSGRCATYLRSPS